MRLKTLNGAPLCEHLDFSEETLLDLNELDIPWSNPSTSVSAWPAAAPDSTASSLKWRRLAVEDTRLRTGWSQPYLPRGGMKGDNLNLSFAWLESGGETKELEGDATNFDTTFTFDSNSEIENFLEHSLIFHDTLLSSQIVADADNGNSVSSASFMTTSFATTTSGTSSLSKTEDHTTLLLNLPSSFTITPLGSLPTAKYIRSIYPQTLTPNLLCVLTALPERREVVVRKGGYRRDLYEIIVADDTNSDFKISFWVQPHSDSNPAQIVAQNALLQVLERVKVGDIILLRHIALDVFRDIVYGQSLRPAIGRARSSIEVLTKDEIVSTVHLGVLPPGVLEAFTRVKRWANAHVAPERMNSRKRKGPPTTRDTSTKRSLRSSDAHNDTLPPDTLEAV